MWREWILFVFTLLCLKGYQCIVNPMWTSRYIRSMAGRKLLSHLAEAQNNRTNEIDLTEWYFDNLQSLPEHLHAKFIQSNLDEETREFLQNSCDKSDAVFTQFGYMLFKGLTGLFMSATTINGILNRGSMFVFSKEQFRTHLGIGINDKRKKIIDLGAGDGKVTDVMSPYFEEVYVTEQSPSMRWRLHWKGYKVLEQDKWSTVEEPYDVISCLNLLDRCDEPLSLLRDAKRALKADTGRLMIAVVLPFNQCVESGSSLLPPKELIKLSGNTWDEQVASLIKDIFTPAGFTLESFSKVPYLCEGDLYENFYVLSDALFVLKPTG